MKYLPLTFLPLQHWRTLPILICLLWQVSTNIWMGQLWSTWGYFTTSPLSSISIPGGQRNMWLSVAMVDWCLLTLKELGIHSWFSHKVYQVTYDTSWNWCSRFVSEAHSKGKTIFNCRLCCPDENAGRKCTIFSTIFASFVHFFTYSRYPIHKHPYTAEMSNS